MSTHTNMADFSCCFQFMHVFNKFTIHNAVKFFRLIHKMNHAKIYVICLQSGQQIFKSFFHLWHLSGSDILIVLPGGTNMSLNVPFFPASFQSKSNVGTDIWFRHPTVQNIDSLLFTGINDFFYFLRIVSLQPFCAQTDFTYF